MPFHQHSQVTYCWEHRIARGEEFCEPISAKDARDNWTRALLAVEHGVFIVRFHKRAVGILASPRILGDVLLKWAGLEAKPHPVIDDGLRRVRAHHAECRKGVLPDHIVRAKQTREHHNFITWSRSAG